MSDVSPLLNILNKSLRLSGKKLIRDFDEIEKLQSSLKQTEKFVNISLSGLEKEISRKLAIETFIGSAELLNSNDSSPEELRVAVTSPGGTTEAGLNYLEEINIDNIITQTISKAVQRGNELSDESNK